MAFTTQNRLQIMCICRRKAAGSKSYQLSKEQLLDLLLYFSYTIFSSKKTVAIFKVFFLVFLGDSATASRMLADTCQNKRFLAIRQLIGRTEVNWALRIKKRRSIYKVCHSECEGPSLRTEAIAVPQQQYLPYWPSMDIRLTI